MFSLGSRYACTARGGLGHCSRCRSFLCQYQGPTDANLVLGPFLFKPRIDLDDHRLTFDFLFTDRICILRSALHSPCTVLPLRFTAPLFQKFMTRYRIAPSLLPVLFTMGQTPHAAERGATHFASTYSSRTKSSSQQSCAYEFQHMEENRRSKENPWSVRHIGVYHHRDPSLKFDLWVLLCSNADGPLELIRDALQRADDKVLQGFCDDPFFFHALLNAHYSDHMRWYLRALGDQLEDQVSTIFH